VGVAALLIITGGGLPSTAANSRSASRNAAARHRQPVFNPSKVTVAVLNGTQVNQLAHDTGARLVHMGYREGTIATAANQTQQSTVVGYTSRHREDAVHVARALGLKTSVVAPVDLTTLQVACPQGSPCTADVVVTIGQNLANS
jgi:hypothetical protein